MGLAELVKKHEEALDAAYMKLKLYDTGRHVVKMESTEFYAELAKSGHDHPEVYRCKCIQDWRNGK
jgi:hypothetical protein